MSHIIAVRPIYNDADLDAALTRLDQIFDAERGTSDGDEAEVLTVLIQDYERKHFPLGPSDPVEAIRFHLDRLGLDESALAAYLGPEPNVADVLGRKRSLTVEEIRRLHEGLGVSVESLIGL